MRGKEAVRAANRRTSEARAEAEGLRAELAQERAERRQETHALRAEIKRLKADHMAEASRLAAEEVTRRLAEIEAERNARGFSDTLTKNALYLKDKFVLNACRYISMTKGARPLQALEMVMTWMTDEDFYGFESPDMIVKLGLPSDGWVASFLRENKQGVRRIARNRIRADRPAAVALDRALQEEHPDIHPSYRPHWYPEVDYRTAELVDDEPVGAAR